ncbi:MAG: hypothetical protein JWP78_2332 [Mucilaginibacter sp.]|nr:hypothetical protein [Mucilaginibacter sp.]
MTKSFIYIQIRDITSEPGRFYKKIVPGLLQRFFVLDVNIEQGLKALSICLDHTSPCALLNTVRILIYGFIQARNLISP